MRCWFPLRKNRGRKVAAKPIIDVNHKGKRVVVDFCREQRGVGLRYEILVNGRPILTNAFAEEVMRWLGNAIHNAEVRVASSTSRGPAPISNAKGHVRRGPQGLVDAELVVCDRPAQQNRQAHVASAASQP